jgi:pilus assembly protein Flp/PilA
MRNLIRLLTSEDGTTAIEYGLIITLVAVAAIAGMMALGGTLATAFANFNTDLR